MRNLRFRWPMIVLVVTPALWGSGEETTTTESVDGLGNPSEASVAQTSESESLAPTNDSHTWVDDELIRTSQMRYSKYSNAELNLTLQTIAELRPEQRRSLLIEIQRRIRTDGHLPFVQSKDRFGRGQQKSLDELPHIEEIRLIATEAVEDDDPESQAAREQFLREQQLRNKSKNSTVPTSRAYQNK